MGFRSYLKRRKIEKARKNVLKLIRNRYLFLREKAERIKNFMNGNQVNDLVKGDLINAISLFEKSASLLEINYDKYKIKWDMKV